MSANGLRLLFIPLLAVSTTAALPPLSFLVALAPSGEGAAPSRGPFFPLVFLVPLFARAGLPRFTWCEAAAAAATTAEAALLRGRGGASSAAAHLKNEICPGVRCTQIST